MKEIGMVRICNNNFFDYLSNPFILTDSTGKILKLNPPTKSLLQLPKQGHPDFVQDIDPCLLPPSQETADTVQFHIGDKRITLHIFFVNIDKIKDGRLYLFDTPKVLKKIDFDTLLDHFDDAVIILNNHAVIEHVNKQLTEYTGIYARKGHSMQASVDKGFLEDSAALRTLKSKKSETVNVKFRSGKTLTITSHPYYDENGEVDVIFNTARDITKLVDLQEELKKAERMKDHYINRLNTLESLVGNNKIMHSSDRMRRVVSMAVKAAQSDSPVFVWGESGVGKELIANLIHNTSTRAKNPFVGVNCSAIPSELIEAELFGYEEGAFTGAKRGGKKGLFEEAKNGTLFLDEITELPFTMQSKLLRVLQEREFMRVGGTKTIPVLARIISSSNLSQEQLLDNSKFRRDLFYRLNVIPIVTPPLRDRREDIFPLAHFFLRNMNIKYNKTIKVSMDLMAKLHHYDWPGNVRELKNTIERLVVMADRDTVDIADFMAVSQFERETSYNGAASQRSDTPINDDFSGLSLMPMKTAFQKVEELLIRKAFIEAGNIKKAAQILQINPCTIHRRVKQGRIRIDKLIS